MFDGKEWLLLEEKNIIEGKKCNVKLIAFSFFVLFFVAALIIIILEIISYDTTVKNFYDHFSYWHDESCLDYTVFSSGIPYCRYSFFNTGEEYATQMFLENEALIALVILGCGVVVSVFVFLLLNYYKITVTDKRIFGRLAFGKRVDLPIDFVTGVSKIQGLKGVTVLSSSKKTSFLLIKNVNEIYEEINKLLINRQSNAKYSVVHSNDSSQTSTKENEKKPVIADELIKFKELLDKGVITEEEFEAKKKQILGL